MAQMLLLQSQLFLDPTLSQAGATLQVDCVNFHPLTSLHVNNHKRLDAPRTGNMDDGNVCSAASAMSTLQSRGAVEEMQGLETLAK